MSKLDKLLGKSITTNIGGVDLEIKPLPIQHLELFLAIEKEETRGQALRDLITMSLKSSVPDATDEEINNISVKYFKDLVEVILDVNGLKDVDKKPAGKAQE